nr:MBL fold metallo-hydrolase [Mitsuokella multacida]
MYSKNIWQKRLAKALACGCLLVASAYPAASAAPAHIPNMHGSVLAGAILNRGIASYKAGHYEAALKDLFTADKQGHMKAARYIGLCYENGYGVKQDSKKAAEWFHKGASRGDITAMYDLGRLYETGTGVTQDYTKAKSLYEKAATRTDHVGAPAMLALGHLYEEGLGTTRGLDMARSWYEKAEADGDGQAPAALARLAAKDAKEATALSGTNETSTLSEESGRKITTRVSPGSALDIQDGVTKIDTSAIWTPVRAIDFSAQHDTMIENADGSQVPMDQPYFTSEQIAPDTWKIQNDGDYCYLLAGDELAVMIDCGYGAGNIREYAQALTDKPVKYVINTHYHFDPTANDAYFDAAFMTKESIPYATVPYDSFEGIDFPRDYPVITVQDGYKLNLGNRELTILTVPHPNHAIGDIAILDPTRRILYTGDELLLANRADPNISLQDFAENMQHLNTARQDFDQLYTDTGEKSGEVFDHYYAAAMYGISPDFKATLVTESAGRHPNEQQTTADGKTLYQRGRVRPGDETKNAPEIIPTGQRMGCTVDGFSVTYIATTSTSSN